MFPIIIIVAVFIFIINLLIKDNNKQYAENTNKLDLFIFGFPMLITTVTDSNPFFTSAQEITELRYYFLSVAEHYIPNSLMEHRDKILNKMPLFLIDKDHMPEYRKRFEIYSSAENKVYILGEFIKKAQSDNNKSDFEYEKLLAIVMAMDKQCKEYIKNNNM